MKDRLVKKSVTSAAKAAISKFCDINQSIRFIKIYLSFLNLNITFNNTRLDIGSNIRSDAFFDIDLNKRMKNNLLST